MNLNFIAPITHQTSYGLVAINTIYELDKLGANVAIFPIRDNIEAPPKFHECIKKGLELAKKPDFDAPCIRLWHQFDMSQFVGKGKHIGFPIFELDTFNDQEKHHLNSTDELMVCSQWAKDIMSENYCNYKAIHIIPLGVDQSIFYPLAAPKQHKTIFFNCGKWEVRKGHDVLAEAFRLAFPGNEMVELWMMCDNIFYSKEENESWRSHYRNILGNKIRFLSRVETQEQVADIMRHTDCGVFPSRAEGWNLEALEMMACGKDVIITNVSAHTEFCTEANSLLIEAQNKESAFDGKWFFNQGNWAKFDELEMHQLVKYLKMIHTIKQDKQPLFNSAGVETARKFTWANTAKAILKALSP